MELLEIGGLLLFIMLLLLGGGVWIAMTLAIVGWVGQAFFTTTLLTPLHAFLFFSSICRDLL